jgi:hypothetical protein
MTKLRDLSWDTILAIGTLVVLGAAAVSVAQYQISEMRVDIAKIESEYRTDHDVLIDVRGDLKHVVSDVNWIRDRMERNGDPGNN